MSNTWIVVPVRSNDVDLTSFVENLRGGYIAPDMYESYAYDQEEAKMKNVLKPHPYAGQNGPNLTDKIIFVNMTSGYASYDGVINLESFGEINIPRLMNAGINYAFENGAENVLVLSNPCDFDTFIISDAISDPDGKNIINISDGVAFIIKSASNVRLNEDLRVWFWAEDFYRTAVDYSSCRPEYFSLTELIPLHINTEELDVITKEDHTKFSNKWG